MTAPTESISNGRFEAVPGNQVPAREPARAVNALNQSVIAIASADAGERTVWRVALEGGGHQVIEAPTTLLLLELARTHQPDLILCAAQTSDTAEFDGYGILNGIRGDSRTASTPCVLTSSDRSEWRPAMAKGADDFLTSPFDKRDLLEAVEARLERRRSINELAVRSAFQRFPSELLEMVVKKTPVAEVLRRIAQHLEQGIGAIAVIPRLAHGNEVETIDAGGFSPRSWPELDRLIGKLLAESAPCANPVRKEMTISLSSSLLLFFGNQKLNQKPGRLWHVPVRDENGNLLGCFEIFLGLERDSDRWLGGANRAALDPILRLAGVLMERQHLFDELTRQNHFDAVTGLPNRKEFERHLQEAYRRGEDSGAPFAIVCLDIDRFQRINDTFGYMAADLLLAEFASRLRQQTGGQDLAARISGDEFALFVPDAPDRSLLDRMALRLVECLTPPYLIQDKRIVLSVSVGIAVYPADAGDGPAEMLSRAETAMAASRQNSQNHVAVWARKTPAVAVDGVDIESYLEWALANNGFILHYQPIYRNRGGCAGYEALVRLRRGHLDKTRSGTPDLVPPGIFLPAAEESGLIIPIGAWVLDEACRQMREWQDSGFACPHIAVNLSARQLEQPALVDAFAASVRKHRVEASRLELELTETAVIGDHQSGKRRLEELKQFGFRIAIDDFGVGYSSLSYLNEFPADKIKIDQTFVRRLGAQRLEPDVRLVSPARAGDAGLPVIGAILSLAANLGAEVVAEGVETPEQYRILSDAGCHEFQGFLFAKPMPPAAVRTFMDEHQTWTTDRFAAQYVSLSQQ